MGIDQIRGIHARAGDPKERKKYVIPKISEKKRHEIERNKENRGTEDTELQKWYGHIMQKEIPTCWETKEKIDIRDRMGWQGSIAHILSKSQIPSVRTHPLNYMILKMWGGTHGQYDSTWENAAKMKIWPYACKIINILYPILTREEKAKLPDVVIQEIHPEKYSK